MIDWRARAEELIAEHDLCARAKAKNNAVDIQIEKDECAKWASHLATQRSWGSDVEIAEACNQLEPRLKSLREKLIIEILTHGTI